jgi:hypothetical protein
MRNELAGCVLAGVVALIGFLFGAIAWTSPLYANAQQGVCAEITVSKTKLSPNEDLSVTLRVADRLVRASRFDLAGRMIRLAQDQARLLRDGELSGGIRSESNFETEIDARTSDVKLIATAIRRSNRWLPYLTDIKTNFRYMEPLNRLLISLGRTEEVRANKVRMLCQAEFLLSIQKNSDLPEVAIVWSLLARDLAALHPKLSHWSLDIFKRHLESVEPAPAIVLRVIPELVRAAPGGTKGAFAVGLLKLADYIVRSIGRESTDDPHSAAENVANLVEYADSLRRQGAVPRARGILNQARRIIETRGLKEPIILSEIVRIAALIECYQGLRDLCWPR